MDIGLVGTVGRQGGGLQTGGFELGHGFIQIGLLARSQHQARTRLAQGMGQLQTQAPRPPGHQSGFAMQIKQLGDSAGHVGISQKKGLEQR
jgi:hypothetical protein